MGTFLAKILGGPLSTLLVKALGSTLSTLVMSFVSEKVIMLTAYRLLEKLAKSSTNTIDDSVLVLIRESLEAKGYKV